MAAASEQVKLRDTVRGKRYRFFEAQGVDELVSITMGLAQEMWALKERQTVVEAIMADKDVVLGEEIESFELEPGQRAQLEADRKAFIDRIFFILREQSEALQDDEIPDPEPP